MTGGGVIETDDDIGGSATHTCRTGWAATLAAILAMPLLLLTACSPNAPPSAILDSSKVGSVVVGRSSRTEVFTVLGQPSRTERSALGEAWIYEARTGDPSGRGLMNGASAASGVVGAFVPFVGLIGSGIGLAGVAMDGMQRQPQVVSLTVTFRGDSVVRDCAYASTAAPAGVTPAAGIAKLVDCQRPAPGDARAL